jgi:hypothetical protein
LGVEKQVLVRLTNHSLLNALFEWGEPEGLDSENFEIKIYPEQNYIPSKSGYECSMRITPKKILQSINDLRIPCVVQDMTKPIFLNLEGEVKGVSVEFSLSDTKNSS